MKKNIVFIAPPAAGKGTQSEMLEEQYQIPHISTGDLLREEVIKGTEFSELINETMTAGQLVRDDIVTDLLEKRLLEPDCDNGYILDGYPRNLNQATILDELLKKMDKSIHYVIYLTIDKELAMQRACGRITCPNCNRIFHKYFEAMLPKVENQCDDCKVDLIQRKDDNEESFLKRFDTYLENVKPLLDLYEKKGLLHTIDSGIGKDYTHAEIEKVLKQI